MLLCELCRISTNNNAAAPTRGISRCARRADAAKRHEGNFVVTSHGTWQRGKPPEERRTPWALPARNKAGRPSEAEPVERVRNPGDGTYPVRQPGVEWIRSGSRVEGARNSRRGATSSDLSLAGSEQWRAGWIVYPGEGITTREELPGLPGSGLIARKTARHGAKSFDWC